MTATVRRLPEGGEYEALPCKPGTNFDGSTKLDLPTETSLWVGTIGSSGSINYFRCQFVVLRILVQK